METFVLHGPSMLAGEIAVNGAKNHALKMITACLLSSEQTTITNVPMVEDVRRMLEIVENIGGMVKHEAEGRITISAPDSFNGQLPQEIVPKLRASIVLLGPLLARYGAVTLPHPGGCNLGKRPIDFFIDGFEALGATCVSKNDSYVFSAKKGLVGAEILFPSISVTGTETMMLAAVLASGTTVLKNAACEPEIVALAEYLRSVGADIEGAGTHSITIRGGELLHGGTASIIPDRIEAGSFMIMGVATNSELTVTNCNPLHLENPIALLRSMGAHIDVTESSIQVKKRKGDLLSLDMVTHEYPGFPTDLQAPLTVLLTQAHGEGMVRETIYDGRLFYTDTLNTMGANITLLDPYRALVNGPTPLRGKKVASPDIRAGIAMVIAGLLAEGETTIQNIYQIDRGYERIEQRLQSIGANIERR